MVSDVDELDGELQLFSLLEAMGMLSERERDAVVTT